MTLNNWLVLASIIVPQIGLFIVGYIRLQIKQKELEMKLFALDQKVKDNQKSFHIHEMQNEKMFDRFDKKLDDVNGTLNEVKNILITKVFK